MVRCSHYPQSPHFLDACDELGLMVWEEPPGWRYVGDAAWQERVVRNVARHGGPRPQPAVGDRLGHPAERDRATTPRCTPRPARLAHDARRFAADAARWRSRPTAGWAEDVFAYDDYHVTSDGNAELLPAGARRPYLVSEAVGALDGSPAYRWIDTGGARRLRRSLHAQVHNIARSDIRYAGLLGWAGFDYASLNGGNRDLARRCKTPGVLDTFRVPKPGAAFYRSQVRPAHPAGDPAGVLLGLRPELAAATARGRTR